MKKPHPPSPLHRRRPRLPRTSLLVLGLCGAVVAVLLPTIASRSHVRHHSPDPQGPPASLRAPGEIVIPGRNLPDPDVVFWRGHYYLYSSQTGFGTPPISLTRSTGPSLYSWGKTVTGMGTVPSWAETGFTWAPDVRYIDGRWLMYFDAWSSSKLYFDPKAYGTGQRAQCIGIAVAKTPAGPFQPIGRRPLVCQFNHHGAIDPRVFTAPGGQLFLVWKSDDNAFASEPPTHLYSERLSSDGLHLYGKRYLLLSGSRQAWNGGLIEAPQLVHEDGYWLFFSGSWYNGPAYSIGLARCDGPEGPCKAVSSRPFLASNAQGLGPGEESLFENSQGWWMVYSPWSLAHHDYRPVALAKIDFRRSGPYLAQIPAH